MDSFSPPVFRGSPLSGAPSRGITEQLVQSRVTSRRWLKTINMGVGVLNRVIGGRQAALFATCPSSDLFVVFCVCSSLTHFGQIYQWLINHLFIRLVPSGGSSVIVMNCVYLDGSLWRTVSAEGSTSTSLCSFS